MIGNDTSGTHSPSSNYNMSSRDRDYDEYRSKNHRSRSRTDAFAGSLEEGHVREALKPRSSSIHRHRHHSVGRECVCYDEVIPRRSRDDNYDFSETRPRRHHSHDGRQFEDDRQRDRRHGQVHSASNYYRSRSGGPDLKQAAGAAVAAGLVEALRSRHDRDMAMRVATAAMGAAATNTVIGRENDRKEKRHMVESALVGLVGNRIINGPRR
ncbi:hypothetical protein GGR57DRAFT_400889 [Xylariaceae sp. FL1272]|nr:hypothetical protein GGR57DRAFT_400889 [Xylariaceae sp. FL1272]